MQIDKVKVAIENSNNKEVQQNFLRIEKFLIDNGHIQNQVSLKYYMNYHIIK